MTDPEAPKPRLGRPTKLTPGRAEKIVQMVKAGAYGHVAARANGIHVATFHAWQARGRDAARDDDGNCLDPADQPFADFYEGVKDAEAAAEVQSIALIRQAANNGTWQAAAWYLERKYSDRWGRRDQIKQEVTGPSGGPVEVNAKTELLAFLNSRREEPVVEADPTEPLPAVEHIGEEQASE